jgi:hypothetical protein
VDKCKPHDRYNCPASECQPRTRNADAYVGPAVSVTTDGGLSVGIGGGLGVDPADCSLTVQIAPGVSVDTDGQ